MYFGLSCPGGGNFYICESNATEFIGCCTTNPCAPESRGECPKANIRAASFSADKYADLPRQDCDDAASIKIWYTCKFNKPPFMGCCASNPCAAGLCTPTDLRPAKLSGDPELRAQFLRPGGIAPSATASATSTATNTSAGLSGGAIGGICAAVAVVLIVIVGMVIWYVRRTRKRQKRAAAPTPVDVPPDFWGNGYRPRGKSHHDAISTFRLPVLGTDGA